MQLTPHTLQLHENADGFVIERSQYIDPAYLDGLKAERDASKNAREKDYMRVASIPTDLVDKWINEGFPFWEASAKQIVAKLKADGLDYFLTTAKEV